MVAGLSINRRVRGGQKIISARLCDPSGENNYLRELRGFIVIRLLKKGIINHEGLEEHEGVSN